MARRGALLLLPCALALVAACTSSASTPTPAEAGANDDLPLVTFTAPTNRDLDVLFVVDTAPGARGAQAKLAAGFATFVETLRAGHVQLPNLHVGVISSDLGAGADAATAAPGCRPGGDRGAFQSAPRGACAASGLPATARFITDIDGVPNFDGARTLADVLACLAPLGDSGCVFRQPFAAALRALGADGAAAPAENAGFLRPNAFLSIVFLTGDDDCSAAPDATLFDPTSRLVADPLGPLTTFRCAEFGLRCGGVSPSRTAAGALEGCASAEDGKLVRLADAVGDLKALKVNRSSVLVAALAGPPTPFTVELAAPALADDPSPWPSVAASCHDSAGTTVARPGVRVEQFVYAFGHNGVIEDVCDDSFGPALGRIAQSLADVLGPPCVTAPIATTMGPRGARADCTITRTAADGDGGAGTPIPACVDNGGVAPCWTLAPDAECPTGKLLSFTTTAADPDVARTSAIACHACASATDPRCR
jgi:hypothetical protein